MAKPTPGPWVARPVIKRIEPVKYDIDCIWQPGLASVSVIRGHEFEAEANARLIAAAPELLTMLTRLMDEVMVSEDCFKHIAPLTLEQARTAIAKATA